MKLDHTQAKRLFDSVSNIKGEDEARALLDELPLSASPSDAKKRAWACQSCAALAARYDAETASDIRKGCRCKPSPAAVKELKRAWEAADGMADFIQKQNATAHGFTIESDGDSPVLCYPVCYCSFVKRAGSGLPALWCQCSLGYAEDMFSQVFSRPIRAELLESVLLGGARCRIKIDLL